MVNEKKTTAVIIGGPKLTDHLFVLGAWLVICVVVFVGLGASPLTDLDEGAFSEATREMLARGDFVSPWLLDAPRFDKPILIHWLQMAAFSVTGFTSYGARLPSALMGLIWVGAIAGWAYLIAARLLPHANVRVYAWAVLTAGTCLGIPAMARAATADATLNGFLVLSLLFVWRAVWPMRESESGRLWIQLGAICVGLGLLTKGPIAILVPAAASLIAAATCGSHVMRRWVRLAFDPVAWGLVILIAAPWYLLQFQVQGMDFVNGFLGQHNLGRFNSTMHGFSAGPLYYPAWILIASLPWTVPVVTLMATLFAPGANGQLLRRPELRMCWAVLIFVLVFFSLSATKLPHYGFYGLSGLVVLISLVLVVGLQKTNLRLLTLGMPLVLLGVLIGFVFHPQGLARLVQTTQDPYYQIVLAEALARLQTKQWLLAAAGCIGLAACIVGFRCFRLGVLSLTLVLGLSLYGLVVPTVMQALREPIVQIAQVIQERTRNSNLVQPTRIITWRLTAPSLSFAAQRIIPASSPTKGDWIVMPRHLLKELALAPEGKAVIIFEKVGLALVSIE
jgi:4-amino-4-deoxy-L-arabinose transferase-like glycosyltransferase